MDLAKADLEVQDRVVEIVQPLVAYLTGGLVAVVMGEAPEFSGGLDLHERWTGDPEPVLDILYAHAPPRSPIGSS